MIPVLFEPFETGFTSNGVGRLSDCVSCIVTEERNGEYECEFEYPITGIHYADIVEGRLVLVDHDETGDLQPFEIYRHTAPIDGIVTYNARHISYRLANVILKPMSASSAASCMAKFETETLTEQPFEFWTDIATEATFKLTHPASVRSMLGGTEGSVLDVYGGEYEFDRFTVKLHAARGADNNVEIRYAKNLSDLEQELDISNNYTAIIPYWVNSETGESVYGRTIAGRGGIRYTAPWTNESDTHITDENGEDITFAYYPVKPVAMDLSDKFQNQPTAAQLEKAAASYLKANKPWVPKENIEVDFVALWQTEEYKNIAPLERVKLCDTVRIIYTALGVDAKAKVIRTEWNALLEKYNKIELGEARTSFSDTIMQATAKEMSDRPTVSMMAEAISHATELIQGGTGGHVVFGTDADGKPNEIFIMDTEDVNTAVNVLRINMNGIGFSKGGINGEYATAWTLDGSFVADFITAGTLNANRVRAGMLQSTDGTSYWDLDGSALRFYDKRYDSYVKMDKGEVEFGHKSERVGKIARWRTADDEDCLAILDEDGKTFITIRDHIQVKASDYIQMKAADRIALYIDGTDTKIRAYDNDDYQFADINSGGHNYIRIDGEQESIFMRAGDNETSMLNIIDNSANQYIDLNSGGATYLRADGKDKYVRIQGNANAYMRIDGTNEYVRIQGNANTYLRIDGKDGYATLHGGANTWVRVDESNGYVWIKATQLIMNGYDGYTGTFTAGDSTVTVKNGIITNVS